MQIITTFIIRYDYTSIYKNTADRYQAFGIKSNFVQPFFVHWDAILGTRLTRQDVLRRRQEMEGKKK